MRGGGGGGGALAYCALAWIRHCHERFIRQRSVENVGMVGRMDMTELAPIQLEEHLNSWQVEVEVLRGSVVVVGMVGMTGTMAPARIQPKEQLECWHDEVVGRTNTMELALIQQEKHLEIWQSCCRREVAPLAHLHLMQMEVTRLTLL